MTTINTLSRQPTKLDYASPTQFKFSIIKLPKVEYFCTAATIPGIELGETSQPTPLKNIPVPGDKLTYSNLTMTFLCDEYLENFRELHGWMVGLGFPQDHNQFGTLLRGGQDRFPTSKTRDYVGDAGKVTAPPPNVGAIYSDATLSVLSAKNNSIVEVRFRDIFPISLSSLSYNQQAADVDYLTCDVVFGYKLYEFAETGASKTTTTTS